MMSRLGYNIHTTIRGGQQYSAAEKQYLPTHLYRLNPSALLVMDDFNTTLAYRQLLKDAVIVHRQYNQNEGGLWNVITPEAYFENTKGHHDPRIVLYVANEPHSFILKTEMEKQVKWYVRVMELFGKAGLSIVTPNWGTGQPDMSWFTQPDKWQVMKPLFDAFKAYPNHYLGVHEYASHRGLEIGNGRVGRHADIAKALRNLGYTMPQTLLTEAGVDSIEGINKRGWRDGMTENQYAALLTDAQRSTWNVDYIKGVMVYCWGSSTPEWQVYDVSDALVLHAALVAANMSVGNPPSVPIPTPLPPPPPDPVPPVVLPKPSPAEITLTKVAACREAIAIHRAAINALEAEIDQLLTPYESKIA